MNIHIFLDKSDPLHGQQSWDQWSLDSNRIVSNDPALSRVLQSMFNLLTYAFATDS